MNPPLNRADKLLGVGTLLLLGLAGYWLGRPQQVFRAPVAAEVWAGEPAPLASTTMENNQVVAVDSVSALVATDAELPQELQETSVDTTMRFDTFDPLEGDSLAHPHTYRRYLGTLNGQPIVVHLSIRTNLKVKSYQEYPAGSWYYRYARQPAEHQLLFRRLQNGQLVLTERVPDDVPTADTSRATWQWQFSWPLRRQLQGRRRAVHGTRQQVIPLREDYSQAVRYELLRLTAYRQAWCEGIRNVYYSTEFPHLLSADSLRLARWQAPPPAARRDSMRHWPEGCGQVSHSYSVTLNDYGLFSYNVREEGYYFGAHPEHDQTGFIVDLTTGRGWQVEELLRPGTEAALLRLLARHLRQDYPDLTEEEGWNWQDVPPLPSSVTFTPAGLYAGYGDYALAPYVAHYADHTIIPYQELRPLVRPGTPLDRMLKARGI
ncbi:hypothetical protein [Hymenobacter sp. CRA2]|uniref:hypothetical protein n=1 Tax=Hymenobacter sp. CRA2 TaxID=1955620 RepID=UPI00098FADC7|nr:hypothetical protein [Hymenobacter sp. CRA2]OON70276.1 hypothetical protein B0919_05970 [Hymenobacter sp. CRA2]